MILFIGISKVLTWEALNIWEFSNVTFENTNFVRIQNRYVIIIINIIITVLVMNQLRLLVPVLLPALS